MKREILLHDECLALASRYGLPDLCDQANTLHDRATVATGAWTPIVILRAFVFDPSAGECAVLFAFAGTGSPETDGYEGVHFTFEADELPPGRAALVEESAGYDEQFIADNLGERIRATAE